MSVCGIDFSSRAVHLVFLDDTTNDADALIIELEGATPFERARSLAAMFPSRSSLEELGVWLVGIEDPHSRANHTAKALGMAAGAIAALLPRELTVVQTRPTEWKHLFCGGPMASKDVVKWHARALWDSIPLDADHNLTDAYGIAWAVRYLNDQAVLKAGAA